MPLEKSCLNCGIVFHSYPSENQKFCSIACRSSYRFNTPTAAKNAVTLHCKECGNAFSMVQSYLDAYKKKFGHEPLYCSIPCSAEGRKKTAEEKNRFVCLCCGKEGSKRRKPGGRLYLQQKFCNQKCKVDYQSKQAVDRFNEGNYRTHIKRHGYAWITIPILGRTGRKHIMEHRYVMSKHLKRDLLADETVHHRDGNRTNNDLSNLELFSSRHGPGQRVVDKVEFAIEILTLYPEFAKAAGVRLEHISDHSESTPECRE